MTELIQLFLSSLTVIAGDPALGYRGAAFVRILNMASLALARGSEGYAQLKELTDKVKDMASQNREPTKEEFEALKKRSDELSAILNPPESTPSTPPG